MPKPLAAILPGGEYMLGFNGSVDRRLKFTIVDENGDPTGESISAITATSDNTTIAGITVNSDKTIQTRFKKPGTVHFSITAESSSGDTLTKTVTFKSVNANELIDVLEGTESYRIQDGSSKDTITNDLSSSVSFKIKDDYKTLLTISDTNGDSNITRTIENGTCTMTYTDGDSTQHEVLIIVNDGASVGDVIGKFENS